MNDGTRFGLDCVGPSEVTRIVGRPHEFFAVQYEGIPVGMEVECRSILYLVMRGPLCVEAEEEDGDPSGIALRREVEAEVVERHLDVHRAAVRQLECHSGNARMRFVPASAWTRSST